MRHQRTRCHAVISLLWVLAALPACAGEALPEVSDLPVQAELPDPLKALSGRTIRTADQWNAERKGELKRLFQHYMYGYLPPAPRAVEATLEREDREFLEGNATLREVTIRLGPPEVPEIHLLLVVPNERSGPAPVFLGLNFCGNHTVVDDPHVAFPKVWMPDYCAGCTDHRAGEAGRGAQKDVWCVDQTIDRGYALATFYCGDIDPDKNDFTDGVHPHYRSAAGEARGPHEWGSIAAWAWGLHRAVDYLVTGPDVDPARIAVIGHSRLGKTALLAGAFDERIALVIPHQAGCGGSAPSRKTGDAEQFAEPVRRINAAFPHWFCDEFKKFNEQVERLPFDQHELIALCAPRPVLLTNAVEDRWADPEGQFRVLQAADPVYKLLDTEGLSSDEMPEPGTLVSSRLGYYIRPGEHSMNRDDWKVFLDYADKHLASDTR